MSGIGKIMNIRLWVSVSVMLMTGAIVFSSNTEHLFLQLFKYPVLAQYIHQKLVVYFASITCLFSQNVL